MKCLVIGTKGNIGSGLLRDCPSYITDKFLTCSRRPPADVILDPNDLTSFAKLIIKEGVDSLILLSAISKPQLCGAGTQSGEINIQLPASLANLCKSCCIKLVFASTEYVYNGKMRSSPKTEDPLNILPTTNYALEKLSAEYLIQSILPEALVLRLPKVYQLSGKDDLLSWIMKDALRTDTVRLASDQFFSPISCYDLGHIIARCLEEDLSGVYNCGGPDDKSRFEYYEIYREYLPFYPLVLPCTLSELGVADNIPRDVSMESSRIYHDTGYKPRSFRSYIETYLV